MNRSLVEIDLPVLVLGLLAIAVSNYDVQAESRGWGRELLSRGVVIGSDSYTAGHTRKQVDGQWIECVQLTIRKQFYGDQSQLSINSIIFPLEYLRRLTIQATILS